MNQIIVGTDRRHVLRTFNGMSHEITYTGPLNIYNIVVHKVIGSVLHPYALTKCCLPLLYSRLDQMQNI